MLGNRWRPTARGSSSEAGVVARTWSSALSIAARAPRTSAVASAGGPSAARLLHAAFGWAFVALPAGTTNGRIAGTMAKAKISISVDAQVLERAKELTPDISRSELIEVALRSWARAQRRKQVEDEVARYYASLSKEDHEQDAAWARLGEEALASGD